MVLVAHTFNDFAVHIIIIIFFGGGFRPVKPPKDMYYKIIYTLHTVCIYILVYIMNRNLVYSFVSD